MKKIGVFFLLSTIALSNIIGTSATTKDSNTTKAKVVLQTDSSSTSPGTVPGTPTPTPTPITPDPTSPTEPKEVKNDALGFTSIPKEIDFGTNDISGKDQAKQSVSFNADASKYDDGYGVEKTNSLQVYDGRLKASGTDWNVSVSASSFEDSKSGAELTGASIKFNAVKMHLNDQNSNAEVKDNFISGAFEVVADGNGQSKKIFGVEQGKQAKYTTDMLFDTSKVELKVPGASLQEGSFEATITWNLDDSAMS